jgi:hypothetical protein
MRSQVSSNDFAAPSAAAAARGMAAARSCCLSVIQQLPFGKFSETANSGAFLLENFQIKQPVFTRRYL